MNIKSKLGKIKERVSRGPKNIVKEMIHGRKVEGFGMWFRILVTSALAIVVSNVIAFQFNLSNPIRILIMVLLCVVVMPIIDIKPRLSLTVVCITILFIGVVFTVDSMFKDNMGEVVWDSGLLGVGVSLVALAVAIYVLQDQVGRNRNAPNMSVSERDINSLKDGYVWVEERREYRCEYCNNLGRYRYYKTLSGIRKHIAREHIKGKG